MSYFVVPANAKSWLQVESESDFPIQNLPYCAFATEDNEEGTIGVRIGDFVVDIISLADADLLPGFDDPFSGDGEATASEVRRHFGKLREQLYRVLDASNGELRDNRPLREHTIYPVEEVEIDCPLSPTAFVDFYSGIYHASNVGRMFRPDQPPLLPNYRHLPIGYNGRASSVVSSGTEIRRPSCQTKGPNDEAPIFGPTKELDFELELGFFTCAGNEMGEPIPISEAEDYILGVVLVNDWSARDTQRWEYQPLGPFLAKSFATTISPYIVPLDALEPFRVAGMAQDPTVLPHLRAPGKAHYDIHLEVALMSKNMKRPQVVCRSNARNLYWSFVQQLAHQASNGTPVEFADLYASGTISGEEEGSFGSMLELTWRGSKPITLTETGETRTFLEDGDEVIMRGWCEGAGYRVGLGECRGKVVA